MSINNKFDQELIEKIKEKKMAPIPRWHFLVKDYVVWGMGAVSLVLGGLAFSVIIYMSSYNDWDMYDKLSGSFSRFVLLTLPYFWIVFLALFLLLVRYNIKYTKSGYRYTVSRIMLVSVISSFILGGIFYAAGLGQLIDDLLGRRLPLYEKIINRRINDWNRPQQGRLAGLVIAKTSDQNFTLSDIERREWDITAVDAEFMPMARIEIGGTARLLGHLLDADSFQAEQIFPASGPGRMFFERGRHLIDMNGHMLPLAPQPDGMMCGRGDRFLSSLEKYPQVKAMLIEGLLENKNEIRVIMEQDAEFSRQLEFLEPDLKKFE